ncbi:MAG: Fur family transcriptional regulator [Pseudomonadota bacterium]
MAKRDERGERPRSAPKAFAPHDHDLRRSGAMRAAEAVCAARGAQLTAIRRRVLELLLESHKPLGAYALLERLREERGAAQPPTIYRALDFLVEHGLAHKVMRLNAFTACSHPGERHMPQFLICSECERISEITDPAVMRALGAAAEAAGFEAHEAAMELLGRCPACREAAEEADAAAETTRR